MLSLVVEPSQSLHDLVLGQATVRIGIHHVASRRDILDEAETERTTTVLVALELGDCGFCGVRGVKSDNTSAAGSSAGLVLYLCLFDLSNGRKQFNKVFIACRPRELCCG